MALVYPLDTGVWTPSGRKWLAPVPFLGYAQWIYEDWNTWPAAASFGYFINGEPVHETYTQWGVGPYGYLDSMTSGHVFYQPTVIKKDRYFSPRPEWGWGDDWLSWGANRVYYSADPEGMNFHVEFDYVSSIARTVTFDSLTRTVYVSSAGSGAGITCSVPAGAGHYSSHEDSSWNYNNSYTAVQWSREDTYYWKIGVSGLTSTGDETPIGIYPRAGFKISNIRIRGGVPYEPTPPPPQYPEGKGGKWSVGVVM